MSKRYFWLKLNENFFEREEIKIIESMKNGKDYIIFYLKLLLKSIKSEGKLLFRNIIPYTPEMLSSITNTDVDTVRIAIEIFSKLGLMQVWDDGTLFMVETQNMIGSETDSAIRVRKHRAHKALEENKESKTLHCNAQSLQCNNAETKSNTEIDIDKDIDKDIEKEKEDTTPPIPYQKIKDLFNSICKSYSKVVAIGSARERHLQARWKQFNFDIDTFEKAFKKLEESDFCKGKNDRNWKADFDWLIENDNNMIKTLEGKYDNDKGGVDNGSGKGDHEDQDYDFGF